MIKLSSADDDKEELKNVCHSVKKFTLRYVLHVSISIRRFTSSPTHGYFPDAVAGCGTLHCLQGRSRLQQRRELLLPAQDTWGRSRFAIVYEHPPTRGF